MPLIKQASIYIHTNVSISEPETNHSPGNGLKCLFIIEYPNDHKSLLPQISGEFTSTCNLTDYVTESWLISTKLNDFDTSEI